MTLNDWQDSLHDHFSSLCTTRKNNPVFALEHDLNATELGELAQEIRGHIETYQPLDRHWLPWVVYSTEIGYRYSGDEYWQTFASDTPGWEENGDRYFIRNSFLRFHKEFNGARPSGTWAEAFSIICWPITHAILPQDLQRQLAKTLYDIRDFYTLDLLQSPESLGRQLDVFSENTSSRFRHLVDEHLLVGQIAAALLKNVEDCDSTLILASALTRIAADLDKERLGREWLSFARNRAATVRLRGLTRGFTDEEDEDEDEIDSEERRTLADLGVEPRLFLRAVATNTWDIRLELPDLRGLVAKFPTFKNILASQRCFVAGVSGAPLARGVLLSGSQQVTLSRWPASSEVLLKFAEPIPKLDFLLKTECLLRPGPRWLFKLLEEGTAVELKTQTIRPGNSYIVLTRNDPGISSLGIHTVPISVTCEGIAAARFDVADQVSRVFSDQLMKLGIRTSLSFRLIPVGVPAAHWDDEGHAEWTTGDSPILAVFADYQVKGIALNLVGPSGARLEVPGESIASPTFIELGPLDPGRYKLHVITDTPSEGNPVLAGTLHITIREPQAWTTDAPASAAVRLLVSPSSPYLEQLWDGAATFEILGPIGRTAECRVAFFKHLADTEPTCFRTVPTIDIPCSAKSWNARFDVIRDDVRTQNVYNESTACEVVVRCQELGQFHIRCEREFVPLRWILRHENNAYLLRLVCLEEQESVSLFHCSFEAPTELTPILEPATVPFHIYNGGGLFIAQASHYRCSILVPPQMNALAELGLKVAPSKQMHSERDVGRLLDILELWFHARIPGDPVSRLHKQRIVTAFKERVVAVLCGDLWAELEQKLNKSAAYLVELRHAISRKPADSMMGRVLYERRAELAFLNSEEITTLLAALSKDYFDLPSFVRSEGARIPQQQWIVDFAFQLMSAPESVRSWAQSDLDDGLCYVGHNPSLLRAARFVTLLRNMPRPTPSVHGEKI